MTLKKLSIADIYRSRVWLLWVSTYLYKIFQKLVLRTDQPIDHVPYLFFVPFAVLFLVISSILTWAFDGIDAFREVTPAYLMLTITLYMILSQSERDIRTTITKIDNYMEAPEHDPDFVKKVIHIPRFQPIIGLLITFLLLPLLNWGIAFIYGNANTGNIFVGAISVVNFCLFTTLYAGILGSHYFYSHLPQLNLKLHRFSPSSSPVIRDLSIPVENSFIAQSTTAFVIILGIIIGKPSPEAFLVASVASIASLIILMFGLLNARRYLRDVVDKARNMFLDEINGKIVSIYASGEAIDEIEKKLKLHFDLYDRLINSESLRVVDWRGIATFVRVLFFPVLALILTNLDASRSLLADVSNLIGSLFQ